MLINYFGLVGANRLLDLLGDSGNKVMMRIMGMIVMVIAVEFFSVVPAGSYRYHEYRCDAGPLIFDSSHSRSVTIACDG